MFEYGNKTLSIRSKKRANADYLVSVEGLFMNASRKYFSYLVHAGSVWI